MMGGVATGIMVVQLCTIAFVQFGVTLAAPGAPNCTNVAYQFFADPSDCRSYFQCYNSQLNHFTCPEGGVWSRNASRPACLQSYDPSVECGTRPYNPPCRSTRYIRVNMAVRDASNQSSPIIYWYNGLVLQSPLYNVMLQFAGSHNDFRFNSTFHDVFWYFITCINGLCGKGNNYWRILANHKAIAVAKEKLGIAGEARLVLEEDGTDVDDDDYLSFLPNHTTLQLIEGSDKWQPPVTSQSTSAVDEIDSAVQDPPADRVTSLVHSLRLDLSSVVTFTNDDLQLIIDMATEDLTTGLHNTTQYARSIQSACRDHLASRDRTNDAIDLLKLYHKANSVEVGGDGGPSKRPKVQ